MSKSRVIILTAFVFVAIAAVVPFARAIDYGFVNFDDYPYRFMHGEVKAGLCLSSVSWAFSSFQEAIWMPLTWVSYMADVSLYGGTSGGMHLHSILIHGLNAGLLFVFLLSLGESKSGNRSQTVYAALAALIWALHPLRVESAVWIAARKDVLCLFWELVALIFWVRFLKVGNNAVKEYAVSMAALLFASFCKPSVMSFPFLAVTVDIFILPGGGRSRFNWKHYVFPLAFAFVFGFVSMQAQAAGGGMRELSEIPLWWRLVNAATSYGLYLFHTVWPAGLALPCYCKWPGMPRLVFPCALITISVAGYAIWRLCGHRPRLKRFERIDDLLLGCVLFFTFGVAPFLGLANFGFQASADRFTYVPSIAVSILVFAGLARLASGAPRVAALSAATAAAVALGVAAYRQTGYWENDLKLFTHVIEVDGDDNFVAFRNLASYYFEVEHDPAKVVYYTDICKKLDWDGAGGVFSPYVISLCELGETGKAQNALSDYMRWTQECFEEGRRTGVIKNDEQGRSVPLLHATAAVLIFTGEYDVAEMHLEELYRKNPDDVFIDYLKGHMLRLRGDEAGAKECWAKIADNRRDDFFWFRWMKTTTPAASTLLRELCITSADYRAESLEALEASAEKLLEAHRNEFGQLDQLDFLDRLDFFAVEGPGRAGAPRTPQ